MNAIRKRFSVEKKDTDLRIAAALLKNARAALTLLLVTTMTYGHGQKPLTSDDLIQMTKAFDEQTVINAIAANGVSLDTSAQGLMSLKSAGVSGNVINAALKAAAPRTAPDNPPALGQGIPDEIGVYVVAEKGSLSPLPVEVVNFRTAGMLGAMITSGIKKAKYQGTVPGNKSAIQLTAPVALVLRCPDGTAPAEYQLVALDPRKESREFTEAKVGLGGASGGVNGKAIPMKFEKLGRNTYKATPSGLKQGEYGILAPGALASANGASSGKLYTFGLIE